MGGAGLHLLGGTPQGKNLGAREPGMGNNNYEVGFKDAMVRKMMGPPAMSATAVAGEVGVPQTREKRWPRELAERGRVMH